MHGLPIGWMVAVGGLAAIQIAAAARFYLRQRHPPPPLPEPAPALSIIVAFKEDSPGLADNIASLLAQDYPGAVEWLFVVGANDPARAALEAAAAGYARAKVVLAGGAPTRSSAKAGNLLAGAAAASADAGVFLFADADLRVAKDWARLMTAGLKGATISTSVMLYLPEGGFASRLRLAWMAFGLPWFEPMGLAAGQSLAVRRADFEALGAADLWRESVSEDLALSARARARGGRVALVMAAAPVSVEPGNLDEALSQFDRWMTLFRYYRRDVWALGFVATAIKLGALVQAVQSPACLPLAAVVLGGDFVYLLLALAGAGRPGLAASAALSPLLLHVFATNYAVSSFYREIVWSGWTYHLDGLEAEAGHEPARAARRARLKRLLACVLGGAALGLAYMPGYWGVLIWAAFVPLLWSVASAPPAAAAAWGALFGTSAYLFGAYWMYGFLSRFIGAGPPEAAVWFLGLSALHGARWGVCAAVAALAPPGPRRAALFVLGAAILEPFLPTLFPAPFAVTQLFHLPTVQCLEILGTAGPALLILAVNAAIYLLVAEWKASSAVFAAVCAAAVLGNELWGRRRLAEIETSAAARPVLRAGLVQGGRRPAAPPAPDRFAQDLPLYADLTRRAVAGGAAELVVWPESTYAGVLDYDLEAPAATRSEGRPLAEALRAEGAPLGPLLLNAIGRGADGRERNVSVLTNPDGTAVGVTEKTFLAPFGEYMPGGRALSWLYLLSPLTGRLSHGTGSRVLAAGPARIGVMICYESFIPAPAERLAGLGANLLIAQTNDSWFDGTAELEEHLRLSVLRAIENRLALIHAANTGVSAAVSPAGRVIARVEAGRADALAWDAPLMDAPSGGPRAARRLFALTAVLWAAGGLWSLKGARA